MVDPKRSKVAADRKKNRLYITLSANADKKELEKIYTDVRFCVADEAVLVRHSLLVEKKTLPGCLEITAWTKENEIMGLKHKKYPLWGVQFHPESILTKVGKDILANFLNI